MTENTATPAVPEQSSAPLPPRSRSAISSQQATRFIFNLGEKMGQPMPLNLLACYLQPDLRMPETLQELESMLINQFSVMDGTFHFLINGSLHFENIKLALQAQRQCRDTFTALARLRQPQPSSDSSSPSPPSESSSHAALDN